MNRNVFYFFFSFLLIITGVKAQSISIKTIAENQQLPSNSVVRIFQDSDGLMWFGTINGLCRYDGHRVLTFRSDLNNPELLTNNEITCIAEDQRRYLWIGTKKGINLLDKKSYRIVPFDDQETRNAEIRCIVGTSTGDIWVGTAGSVLQYHPDLTLKKKHDETLPVASVNSIYEDLEGNIWVSFWNAGLYKQDKNKNHFIKFPPIGKNNNPFKVFQDNRKQYWVCTWEDGLFLLDPIKSLYKPLKNNNSRNNAGSRFFSITQDGRHGYVWAMSDTGIYTFHYTNAGKLQEIDLSGSFKEFNNIYSEIIKDKEGNLWIGSFSEGILTIDFNRPSIQNYAMIDIKNRTGLTPNITALCKDHEGDIWINQNRRGLGVFSPQKDKIRFYDELPALRDNALLNIVSCITSFRSDPDVIWIGPENESAVYRIKKEKGSISIIERIDLSRTQGNTGYPRLLYEDKRNNIWIVTTNGLSYRRRGSKDLEAVKYSFGLITGITEDSKGTIWIGTKGSGVYQLPVSDKSIVQEKAIVQYKKSNANLSGDNIQTLCADAKNRIWIGTKEGNMILYDGNRQSFHDKSQSFSILSEEIQNILTDTLNHIWVVTNKRVIEYNPDNEASKNFNTTDGVLVNSFMPNSFYKDNTGQLFLGGNKGISVFSPSQKLSERPKGTKVIISDVKINNQSVFQNNTNNRFDIKRQKLMLQPNDRNIEIDFSSLNYMNALKIYYAYKMVGVDEGWIYTEDNRQFAFYNQLQKGDHRFLVKATDENRLWGNQIIELSIYKHPAFYETWWAYTFYFLLILTTIYFSYVWVKNRVNLRNRLKIAQIEIEKSEELAQTKLRYFTNVSHDFLTPLTIISCLIDDIEMSYEGKIFQFNTMRSNINRLRRLLQQVLDFRKVESGNMKLKVRQGDIETFIRDVCYVNFSPLIKKKEIDFFFNSEEHTSLAYFDADKIDKIVFNLLSNAFKYTPEKGKIEVRLHRFQKERHTYLSLIISDTGIGIAPENIEHIFTRFYTNRSVIINQTNGIGLSLVKDLLDLHHGCIRVESEINRGTIFTITLPIDEKSYNEQEINQVDSAILPESSTPYPPPHNHEENTDKIEVSETKDTIQQIVLLVEDNIDLLALMTNLLSKHYQVETAQNGHEAMKIVREKGVNIIVSDVMMPEMDGLELCRILKKNINTSHIPVILLTAKNSADDRIECYNAGADGYITKPFDLKVLEARINNFLLNQKARQKEFKSNIEINIPILKYQSADEQFLNKAIKIIEENLEESEFGNVAFADAMNMSTSSLYRKIKNMTGLSPVEFIRNIRLKHACMLLKNQSALISEVAYSVGFTDPKYFTNCFKTEFGITPREFQRAQKEETIL